jgi:hypothetical protein
MCRHVLLNIGPYILLKSKTAMPTEVLWRLQTPGTRLRSVTPSRPRCAPLTDGAAAGIWRAETAASGLYGGDVAPKCFYGMTYHNRVVLWHVRRGGTHLRGVAPLTDGAAAGTWRGETDASGLHGGNVAVGLARMLLPGVPLG